MLGKVIVCLLDPYHLSIFGLIGEISYFLKLRLKSLEIG